MRRIARPRLQFATRERTEQAGAGQGRAGQGQGRAGLGLGWAGRGRRVRECPLQDKAKGTVDRRTGGEQSRGDGTTEKRTAVGETWRRARQA